MIEITRIYDGAFKAPQNLSHLKKDSSLTFMHHNPSQLDHKRPDPDHPKAQDKCPQAIFV